MTSRGEYEGQSTQICPENNDSDEKYSMQMKKNRGMAVILAYSEYESGLVASRKAAATDVSICKVAFERLHYNVKVYWNLRIHDFRRRLNEVSKADHSASDSLVVIFMSHGGVHKKTKIEYLETYNGRVDTVELWKNFTPDRCPTLAGKPKMFFIQACRGDEVDKGVRLKNRSKLRVQTDSLDAVKEEENDYFAIPVNADMLIMWASYPGMFAFNSFGDVINGSVFLHFLSQILTEYAQEEDLSTMLLRITRKVATLYESSTPNDKRMDRNKQIPQTMSTLIRKVYFLEDVPRHPTSK